MSCLPSFICKTLVYYIRFSSPHKSNIEFNILIPLVLCAELFDGEHFICDIHLDKTILVNELKIRQPLLED